MGAARCREAASQPRAGATNDYRQGSWETIMFGDCNVSLVKGVDRKSLRVFTND